MYYIEGDEVERFEVDEFEHKVWDEAQKLSLEHGRVWVIKENNKLPHILFFVGQSFIWKKT